MAAAKNPPRGEAHFRHKLTDADITLIRKLVAERDKLLAELEKISYEKLGEKFEVHPNTIRRIGQFVVWKHVM